MTKKEFASIIKKITLAYGERFQVSDEKLDLWWQYFGTFDKELLDSAAMEYIGDNTYAPTIADLKKIYCIKLQNKNEHNKRINNNFKLILSLHPDVVNDLEPTRDMYYSYIKSKPYPEQCIMAEKIRNDIHKYIKKVETDNVDIEPISIILKKIINMQSGDNK